jgi:hypothetical protein
MSDVRLWILVLPIGLFCLMVAATVAGHRLASARPRRIGAEEVAGTSAIDAATRHQAAYDLHTPTPILFLLLVVAAFAALLAGHDMGGRKVFNWLHTLVFAGVVSLTIWVIYDPEMPRYGLIRVDNYDQLIRGLRDDFVAFDGPPK